MAKELQKELQKELLAEGFVILPEAAEPTKLKLLRRETSRLFADSGAPQRVIIKNVPGTNWHDAFARPAVEKLLNAVLGEALVLVRIEAFRCPPGQRQSALFNREADVAEPRPRLAKSVNVLLALDPCVELNGAPRIARGTHQLGNDHPERPVAPSFDGRLIETVVVETATMPLILEKGGMAAVLGTTWRRHGENRSAATRLHLEATYCQKDAIRYFEATSREH